MPLFNMADLRTSLPPGRRLIGLDLGSRVIGVALSDVRLRLASPYGQLRRGKLKTNAAEISRIATKEEAGGLVVGLPLGMEGEFGPAAQGARDWAHAVSAATGLPAAMWDERETTADAHQMLIAQSDMGRQRRAAMIDRMAAALMLQAALNSLPAPADRSTPEPDAGPSATAG